MEKLSARQRLLVAVVMLTMASETLDIAVPGIVYPRLIQEWGIPIAAVTVSVTAAGLAMAVGSAVGGPIADRFGRRPVILVGVPLYGATTILMGFATSIEMFTGLRLLAGLGLGAVMPVLLASVAEGVPSGRRGAMVRSGGKVCPARCSSFTSCLVPRKYSNSPPSTAFGSVTNMT